MTAFFVPGAEPERAEARYAELAATASAPVAPADDRVHTLEFVKGAEAWTATVGQPLAGRLGVGTSRRAARSRKVTDPATVQAIFPVGDAYRVVTNAPPVGSVDDSTWDNPFVVTHRDTRAVARFDG